MIFLVQNIAMRVRHGWRIGLLLGVFVLSFESCQKTQSLDGLQVSLTCTASNCLAGGEYNAFVIVTSGLCSDLNVRAVASGNTVVQCSPGGGCSGTVSGWVDNSGHSIREVPAGTYSICGVIDFNNDYVGSADSGDAVGTLTSTSLAGTDAKTLSTWSNVF